MNDEDYIVPGNKVTLFYTDGDHLEGILLHMPDGIGLNFWIIKQDNTVFYINPDCVSCVNKDLL